MRSSRPSGFTLIELLIVVAIIAILAAIALPNFLEAQTRSKLTRAAADMRSLVTALASYSSDTGHLLPVESASPVFGQCMLARLTTPVGYMTTMPNDVFWQKREGDVNDPPLGWFGYLDLTVTYELGLTELSDQFEQIYLFTSRGTDGHFDVNDSTEGGGLWDFQHETYHSVYDPTNGTVSSGDLYRGQEGMIGFGATSNAGSL